MEDKVIDAPCYPRAFSVTQLDYETADVFEAFKPSKKERRESHALMCAMARELMALRECVHAPSRSVEHKG